MTKKSRTALLIIILIVLILHFFLIWMLSTVEFSNSYQLYNHQTPISFEYQEPEKVVPLDKNSITLVNNEGGGNNFQDTTENEIPDANDSIEEPTKNEMNQSKLKEEKEPPIEKDDGKIPATIATTQPANKEPLKNKIKKSNAPLNVAQLTQGFVNHLNKNKGGIKTIGNIQGNISGEQIAIERFEIKIMHCFMSAIKRRRLNVPSFSAHKESRVQLIINRDGSLYSACMIESTGTPELDKFIIASVYEASSLFPRVPSCIAGPFYTFPTISLPPFDQLLRTLAISADMNWTKIGNS